MSSEESKQLNYYLDECESCKEYFVARKKEAHDKVRERINKKISCNLYKLQLIFLFKGIHITYFEPLLTNLWHQTDALHQF